MAVTIIPMPDEPRLCVVGDIHADLAIPAAAPLRLEDREPVDAYYIALSDGSLIQASFHHEPRFQVIVEGAGSVTVDKAGRSLSVDWCIEWVNVASNHASMARAHKEPASLPLFDGWMTEAA
jgi:hypothetical protein